jgi:hypothetical protein
MTERTSSIRRNKWGMVRRGAAAVTLAGAAGLAGAGVFQLVDGVLFSSPDVDSYVSHSTSDPGYIRDATAQSAEVWNGMWHTGEGVLLGVGVLLLDDLGIAAAAVRFRAEVQQPAAPAEPGVAQVVDLNVYRRERLGPEPAPPQQAI